MGTAAINPQIFIPFYLWLCGTATNLGLQVMAIVFFFACQ